MFDLQRASKNSYIKQYMMLSGKESTIISKLEPNKTSYTYNNVYESKEQVRVREKSNYISQLVPDQPNLSAQPS